MLNSDVGSPTANSYVSVEFADSVIANSVHRSAWPTSASDKAAALIEATRILDSQFDWVGVIASSTQSLRWPRAYAVDADGRSIENTIVPTQIKVATVNLAYFLLQNGGPAAADAGLKGLKIGPIDLKFDDNSTVIGVPPLIVSSLRSLGRFTGSSNRSVKSVNAIRS